jgi:(p)ppGpp synthase/HD superfamily hydrolase
MLYTPLTKRAMQIACEAHHGQVDRGGVPYIFHPYHLAEQMETEDEVVVALLHDVVEDTHWTWEALSRQGFSRESMAALKLLTHDPSVPYLEYVTQLKDNPLARRVKLADLRHNSDTTRLAHMREECPELTQRYAEAIRLLMEETEWNG